MYLAFSTINHPLFPPAKTTISCALDPSRPVQPNTNLSSTDRRYLAKIKAKFLNAKQRAMAVNNASADDDRFDDSVPVLPEDLDEMEDLIYDRGPENVGQAKLFGAWLDESVAGRKAVDSTVKPMDQGEDDNVTLADKFFSKAINVFGRGMYIEATQLFSRASELVGKRSKLGGQYQLWEAQALDASGKKKEATQLFSLLCTHDDSQVRKVSRELLFIVTAPKIQLDKKSFMEIPDIDTYQSPSLANSLLNLSNFKTFRTSLVEKPPEPYSLEWYMSRETPQKVEDHSTEQALAIAAAIFGTLAFMASSPM